MYTVYQAYEVGGNDISAKCSGSTTNLHAAWGTCLILQVLTTAIKRYSERQTPAW